MNIKCVKKEVKKCIVINLIKTTEKKFYMYPILKKINNKAELIYIFYVIKNISILLSLNKKTNLINITLNKNKDEKIFGICTIFTLYNLKTKNYTKYNINLLTQSLTNSISKCFFEYFENDLINININRQIKIEKLLCNSPLV